MESVRLLFNELLAEIHVRVSVAISRNFPQETTGTNYERIFEIIPEGILKNIYRHLFCIKGFGNFWDAFQQFFHGFIQRFIYNFFLKDPSRIPA